MHSTPKITHLFLFPVSAAYLQPRLSIFNDLTFDYDLLMWKMASKILEKQFFEFLIRNDKAPPPPTPHCANTMSVTIFLKSICTLFIFIVKDKKSDEKL